MSQQIPLQPVPAQQLQVTLGNMNCELSVYLAGKHLYVDTAVNGVNVALGVIARNLVPLVPTAPYSSFTGNLLFVDTQGSSDPTYDGLGARYVLLYLTAADYAAIVAADAQ